MLGQRLGADQDPALESEAAQADARRGADGAPSPDPQHAIDQDFSQDRKEVRREPLDLAFAVIASLILWGGVVIFFLHVF